MLWRLAFSAVALVFGLSLGAGLTRYMVQPELDHLRNQIEMQAIAHTEAEALWHVHRNELLQSRLVADARAENLLQELVDWKGKAETEARASIEALNQLDTCHNDFSMALESVEQLRSKLDKIDKICTNGTSE